MKRLTLLILFIISSRVFGQTAEEKIENAGKKIETALDNIGNLKGIFGKKDKTVKADVSSPSDQAKAGK